MVLSVVIVSANTRKLLEACVASVQRSTEHCAAEVIVVDNASTDGSVQALRHRFPDVRLIENVENRGFAAANNQALMSCQGHFALLLNSDTIVSSEAIDEMLKFLEARPAAGVVGCRLVGEDGRTQPSASGLPGLRMQVASFLGLRRLIPARASVAVARAPLIRGLLDALSGGYFTPAATTSTPQRVEFLSGACMMMRRETWESIGLLDESIFLYLEDADWCRRARDAGWELFYIPSVRIVHFGGRSFAARSAGRTHHISRERVRSLFYYFRKYEPPWKIAVLKLVVVVSILVRLGRLRISRAAQPRLTPRQREEEDLLVDVLDLAWRG